MKHILRDRTITLLLLVLFVCLFPQYFLNDSFGLQTLNSSGKVHLYTMPGVQHTTWHGNQKVFDKFIEPHLK